MLNKNNLYNYGTDLLTKFNSVNNMNGITRMYINF